MSFDAIVDYGCGGDLTSPPSLILLFLGSNRTDMAALFSVSRAWNRYGDSAWRLLKSIYNDMVPSPTRFFLDTLRQQPLKVPPKRNGSIGTRCSFDRYWALVRMHRANVYVAHPPEGRENACNFQRGLAHNHSDTGVVLFGEDLEFFTALQLISESMPATARSIITVIVGPAFRGGVNLSSPRLVGRFVIVNHERDTFQTSDGGLLAVHPSALSATEDIAASVLGRLGPQSWRTVASYAHTLRQGRTRFVFGVDAAMGRMLAGVSLGVDKQNGLDAGSAKASWGQAIAHWAKQYIRPNGPHLIFRSFCDDMYPLSFCAPAFGGFYNVGDMEDRLQSDGGLRHAQAPGTKTTIVERNTISQCVICQHRS